MLSGWYIYISLLDTLTATRKKKKKPQKPVYRHTPSYHISDIPFHGRPASHSIPHHSIPLPRRLQLLRMPVPQGDVIGHILLDRWLALHPLQQKLIIPLPLRRLRKVPRRLPLIHRQIHAIIPKPPPRRKHSRTILATEHPQRIPQRHAAHQVLRVPRGPAIFLGVRPAVPYLVALVVVAVHAVGHDAVRAVVVVAADAGLQRRVRALAVHGLAVGPAVADDEPEAARARLAVRRGRVRGVVDAAAPAGEEAVGLEAERLAE